MRRAPRALVLVLLASAQPGVAAPGRPVEWRVQGLDEVRLETLIRDADSGVSASGACQRLSNPIVVTLNRSIAGGPELKVAAAVRFHPFRAAFIVEPVGSPRDGTLQFDRMSTLAVHGRSYPIDDPVLATRAEDCGDL